MKAIVRQGMMVESGAQLKTQNGPSSMRNTSPKGLTTFRSTLPMEGAISMMPSPRTPGLNTRRFPDYGDARRRTVLSLLRGSSAEPGWAGLPPGAKLMYAVGALVCSEVGVARQEDINAALNDRSACNYATQLLYEARAS